MVMRNQKEKSIVTSLLMLTIIAGGLLVLNPSNSVYADSNNAKVSCKDLAVALISWDGLYAYIDGDDITDLEDDFGDDPNNDVDPSSFDAIVDDHMEDVLDDFNDADCKKHISDDNKDWIEEEVDFER
jgi:hypothetical protein